MLVPTRTPIFHPLTDHYPTLIRAASAAFPIRPLYFSPNCICIGKYKFSENRPIRKVLGRKKFF